MKKLKQLGYGLMAFGIIAAMLVAGLGNWNAAVIIAVGCILIGGLPCILSPDLPLKKVKSRSILITAPLVHGIRDAAENKDRREGNPRYN